MVASLDRLRSGTGVVAQRLDNIAMVRAIDDVTVEIELTRADALLPALLSHPLLGIAPTPMAGTNLDGTVSSGPMRISDQDSNALVSSAARMIST